MLQGLDEIQEKVVEIQPSVIEKLLDYKKQGYVFHGSANPSIKVLSPRPAADVDSTKTYNNDTAVFGTTKPEAAVIFGVMPIDIPDEVKGGQAWSIGEKEDSTIVATIPTNWLPYIEGNVGTVYVLDGDKFETSPIWQTKSHEEVTPVESVTVTLDDFYALGGKIEWV